MSKLAGLALHPEHAERNLNRSAVETQAPPPKCTSARPLDIPDAGRSVTACALPVDAARELLRAATGDAAYALSERQIRERELALSYLRADYVACSSRLFELSASLTS